MNTKNLTSTALDTTSPFAKLVRDSGMALLCCDAKGKLIRNKQSDWLVYLLSASPLVRLAITSNCTTWTNQNALHPVEAFQGLWLVPVRKTNKRDDGIIIGVIVTGTALMTVAQ